MKQKAIKTVSLFIFLVLISGWFLPLASADLTIDEGDLQEDFNLITGWTNGSSGNKAMNATYVTEGNNSLNMTAVASGTYWIYKYININFSTATNFAIDIYVGNTTSVNAFGFYFSSWANTSWTKQCYIALKSYMDVGWNRMVLNKSDFTFNGGESFTFAMRKIRFQLDPLTVTSTVFIDNFRTNYTSTPKIIISHDGMYSSIDQYAEPIADSYGFDLVRMVHNSTVGDPGMSSLTNLTRQYNKGWDICNHGEQHLDLITLNAAQLDREVTYCYNWLIAHGFTRSAHFFCYPYGHYNDTVVDKIREHHVMARDSTTARYEKHYLEEDMENTTDSRAYRLKGFTVTNTTTYAQVMAAINGSMTTNGIMVFIFHALTTTPGTPAANYWNYTNYTRVLDYLYDMEIAGNLDVTTLSQYYNDILGITEDTPLPYEETTNYLTQVVIPILIGVVMVGMIIGLIGTVGLSKEIMVTILMIVILGMVCIQVISTI